MLAIIPLPLPLRLPFFLILAFLPILCFGMQCVDLKCPAAVRATKSQMDLVDNKLCRDCEDDCFHSGYSVCSQSQNYNAQSRLLITRQEDQCHCSHSGPAVGTDNSTEDQQICRPLLAHSMLLTVPQDLDIGDESIILRNCYSSAIRKLPTPNATNDAPSGHPFILVIIDQFWHSDYWKGLRPEQLYLFYEFPVSKQEHCEAKVQIPTVEDMRWINASQNRDQPAVTNSGLTWVCKASLRILMSGIEKDDAEIAAHYDQLKQQYGQEQTVDAEFDEHDESNSHPEVLFERDIFAGAKRVRFHFELMVHRDNLLVTAGAGGDAKPKFASRKTLIKSDSLDFDLYPNIYGNVGKSPVKVQQNETGTDGQPTVVQPIEMMEENGTMGSTVGTVLPMPTAAQQEEMKTSSTADGHHSTRADWLLLRKIIIFMLFLLAIFLVLCILLMLVAIFWAVAFCHKRYFPCNGTTMAAGKTKQQKKMAKSGYKMSRNTQGQRRRQATK